MKASNIGWSAAGLVAPLLVALAAVPPLLQLLGRERFGLLSLAWALTAMAGLFDLGIGRAITRAIAAQIGKGEADRAAATLQAGVRLSLVSGAVGASLLALAIAAGADHLLRFHDVPADEVRAAALWLALGIPLQPLIATYRGACEAMQAFRGVSLVRMALGVANFAVPLAVSHVSPDLRELVIALLLTRVLALGAFGWLAWEAVGRSGPRTPLATHEKWQLLRSGGWFTVSAIISPLLVQADRFFISARVSAAAVATYTVPFDMIAQLLVGVTAVSSVAFPTIATLLHRDAALARHLFHRWTAIVTLGMAVICGAVAVALPVALPAWVGTALPPESVVIARWLCLGVWINAVGSMYFAWLHSQGRFRVTALIHAAELPAYVIVLLALLAAKGVEGAAIAWVLRVTADTLALVAAAHRPRAVQQVQEAVG
jgi:O-antigen/teichoic acid export membrane protein